LRKQSYPVGIDELFANENSLIIFPNPSNNQFTISFSTMMRNASLKMFNSIGEEVYNETVSGNQQIINTKLSSGIYFVQVKDEERQYVQKLIIQ